ncbi:MAG: type II secretion system F family protein [Humibacillus sp.]|nr:type II secretion system F family protein [Humibacillus sp.]MDN5777142.1 type II secretion system F family protein [Humibacillus sp.]
MTLAILGALAGLGLWVVVREFTPSHPQLNAALKNLSPDNLTLQAPEPAFPLDRDTRVGAWIDRHLSTLPGFRPPLKDLDILSSADPTEDNLTPQGADRARMARSVQTHYGRKAKWAVMGFVAPLAYSTLLTLGETRLPVQVPAIASFAVAALCWVVPDQRVRAKAAEYRDAAGRACVAYTQLIAIARYSGMAAESALFAAADVSDDWIFRRIREELNRAQWAGTAPWEGLRHLSRRIDIPALMQVADIMALAHEAGASVATQLLARADSLDDAILAADDKVAAKASTTMAVPLVMTVFVFLFTLLYAVAMSLG